MEDGKVCVYHEGPVSLDLIIQDGCLRMDSEVLGPSYDSECHYVFSKEETDKLFKMIIINRPAFIAGLSILWSCRKTWDECRIVITYPYPKRCYIWQKESSTLWKQSSPDL